MHIYATCLFKESVFLRKSKLPLYQKLEVPESCSTLHHLIMVASCLQKIELWYPSFGLQLLIVISVVLYSDCCKSMKNCRDWAFSNSGLEAGLPASLSAADVGKMWRAAEKRFRGIFSPPVLNFCIAAAGKICLMQRSSRCGHVVVVSKMCYAQHSDCVQDCALSCDMWLLQTNEQLPR